MRDHQILDTLRQNALWFEPSIDGFAPLFEAIGNAELVLIGEASHGTHEFYRARAELTKSLIERGGFNIGWNLRDTHMMQTLASLLEHVRRTSGTARAVVWAHNSHLGDARATDMHAIGEVNLGQLVRERYGERAFLIGFTTHTGSVTAADDSNAPLESFTAPTQSA